MNIIKNLPLAITGLILAILSLSKVFADFSSVFFIIGSILIFMVLLKLILLIDSFANELNNLIALSTFGTFSMALMLFSTYLKPLFLPLSQDIAFGIWVLGIIIHLSTVIVFTKSYMVDRLYWNNNGFNNSSSIWLGKIWIYLLWNGIFTDDTNTHFSVIQIP